MTLFLDSAHLADARRAAQLGFVRGVTTNPALLRRASAAPEKIIPARCALDFAPVFYTDCKPNSGVEASAGPGESG